MNHTSPLASRLLRAPRAALRRRTRRTAARLAAVGALVALLGVTATLPAGADEHEPTRTVTVDETSGSAGAVALDVHLLGRHLLGGVSDVSALADRVTDEVRAVASGTGLLLAPSSAATTSLDGESRRSCVQNPLQELLGAAGVALRLDVACGEVATSGGSPSVFSIESRGQVARLVLGAESLLEPVFDEAEFRSLVDPILDLAVSGVDEAAAEDESGEITEALRAVDEQLGGLLGTSSVSVSELDLEETVGSLLDRLTTGDLLAVVVGDASSSESATPERLLSSATTQVSVVELLPDLLGPGEPLARITVGDATASVEWLREEARAVPSADEILVRIETPLVGDLGLEELLDGTIPGLSASSRSIEVRAGESVSLFCGDDDVLAGTPLDGALCSTISVGSAEVGEQSARASLVDVHLLKGLPDELGTLLGDGALGEAFDGLVTEADALLREVDGVFAAAGLPGPETTVTGGEPSDQPGVRLTFGGAEARVDGAREITETAPQVEAKVEEPEPLPRTGGSALPALLAPALVASGLGFHHLLRRRS